MEKVMANAESLLWLYFYTKPAGTCWLQRVSYIWKGLLFIPTGRGYMLILRMSLRFLPSETQHNYPGDYVMPDL